jgi:hypothetical protein
MTRATLIVDGQTRLDDELEEWHKRPPELLADMIKPGVRVEPYLKAAAMALAEATIRGNPITIKVNTRPLGWTLTVDHVSAHAIPT